MQNSTITTVQRIARGGFLAGLVAVAAACVVTTREGYWDRDHHRYWHDHAWHDCVANDVHCR
ncbi:MAG TPA: hypothetical protein VME42_11680 [Steroidobacteraceae bacterium]|nr:hypothetical protein [Steroidobacteraceae bacterium]